MSSATTPKTTSLLIRNVDAALHERLKARARANRRSMSEEAREMLRSAIAGGVANGNRETLLDIADRIFGPDGVDLDLPPRRADLERPPVDFGGPDDDR